MNLSPLYILPYTGYIGLSIGIGIGIGKGVYRYRYRISVKVRIGRSLILSPSSGVFPLLLKHYFQDVFQDRDRGALTIAREKMFVTLGMAIRKDLDRALSRKIKRTLRTLTETGIADKLMKEAMARLTSPPCCHSVRPCCHSLSGHDEVYHGERPMIHYFLCQPLASVVALELMLHL